MNVLAVMKELLQGQCRVYVWEEVVVRLVPVHLVTVTKLCSMLLMTHLALLVWPSVCGWFAMLHLSSVLRWATTSLRKSVVNIGSFGPKTPPNKQQNVSQSLFFTKTSNLMFGTRAGSMVCKKKSMLLTLECVLDCEKKLQLNTRTKKWTEWNHLGMEVGENEMMHENYWRRVW